MENYSKAFVFAASFFAAAAAANAEDVMIKGTVTEIFGDRAVIDAGGGKKHLVNFGPKVREQGLIKTGDAIEIDGDLKQSGEVRAFHLTMADGRKMEFGKDRKTWREWLLGDDKKDAKMFTASDARKVATDKGYTLAADPVGEKRHFVATATKDGKTFEIDVHRDGRIVEHAQFAAADAKAAIVAKGYEVVADPEPMKKHYEALARKNSEYFEVHAHRDGEIKEARKVDKSDPRWGKYIP